MNTCSHEEKKIEKPEGEQKEAIVCILIAAVLTGVSFLLPWRIPRFAVCLAAYLAVGLDVVKETAEGIARKEPFDECLLMTAATIGAAALGECREAAAVMLFYRVGELLEDVAVGRSERNIRALLDVRPDYANLEQPDGSAERTAPDTVKPGQVIVIRPGERIPLDGTVLSGESSLDTSALTGESLPRDVRPGDSVYSGCLNGGGVLRLRVSKSFEASAASRILELTENAAERKQHLPCAENAMLAAAVLAVAATLLLA